MFYQNLAGKQNDNSATDTNAYGAVFFYPKV